MKMMMVMIKVHTIVKKNLGQGMMKRRKGGVVGGSVDVSSSLWRDKVFPSIVAITLLGVASRFAIS